MTNKNVAIEWCNLMISGNYFHKPLKGHRFYGIDKYLVSFDTPICEYDNFVFKCSTKFYSKKTQRHRFYLNLALMDLKSRDLRVDIETVDIIPGIINI